MGASLGAGSEVLSNYTKKLLLLKYHIRAMPSFPKQISFIDITSRGQVGRSRISLRENEQKGQRTDCL